MERILLSLIVGVLENASPMIIESIKGWVKDLKAKAAATPNPWDDVLASFLEKIVGE